jgi:excisionase family DNA binding protein
MQVDSTRMLRVKTVAEMFDVSPQTIYRAIESGRLEALKLGSGRAVRIPESSVRAFAEGCAWSQTPENGITASGCDVPGEVA